MQVTKIATALGVAAVAGLIAVALPRGSVADTAMASSGAMAEQMIETGKAQVLEVAGVERPAREPIAFEKLLRVDEHHGLTISDDVATEVRSHVTVQKIGFGKSELVEIVTTDSGTYTTDGLASPHVRYTGVETAGKRPAGLVAGVWERGHGWRPVVFAKSGSIVTFRRVQGGGAFIANENRTCVAGRGFVTCD